VRFLVLILLFISTVLEVSAQKKRAFVVGVQNYEELTTLEKTKADAEGYSSIFKDYLNFETTVLIDPSFSEFLDQFASFAATIDEGDQVAFVFSGHGWSDGSNNYVAMKDAPFRSTELALKRLTFDLQSDILSEILAKKPELVVAIVDACRDNPFDLGTKSVNKGLVPQQNIPGTIVVYSAGANEQALERLKTDDPSPYSVFTRTLLPSLKDPTKPLMRSIDEARAATTRLASGVQKAQRPAVYSDISIDFCFAGACNTNWGVETPEQTADREAWQLARDSGKKESIEAYLRQFPTGLFLADARAFLSAFELEDLNKIIERSDSAFNIGNYELAFELASEACNAGEQRSCFNVGNLYEFGKGVKEDLARARRIYEGACTNGHLPACETLALMLIDGSGGATDKARGIRLLRSTCEQGDEPSCVSLTSELLQFGSDEAALAEGMLLARRLCDDDFGVACENLAKAKGYGVGVDQDFTAAREFARKSCSLEPHSGCRLYGDLLLYDPAGPVDEVAAAAAFKTACDLNDHVACFFLAKSYEDGVGVNANMSVARDLHRKACDAEVWDSCTQIGFMAVIGLGGEKSVEVGLTDLRRACGAHNGKACGALSSLLYHGQNVATDKQGALIAAAAGCEIEDSTSCAMLAFGAIQGFITQTEPGAIMSAAESSCSNGNGFGCYALSQLWHLEIDGKKDKEKAVSIATRGCELQDGASCGFIGDAYRSGQGIRRSNSKAREYFRKACDLGDFEYCSRN
jgi:TPR repeat protein